MDDITTKKPVSKVALWRRINRALAPRNMKLCKVRHGGYLLIDKKQGRIVRTAIDLESFAQLMCVELRLCVLKTWETLDRGKEEAVHA